MSFIYILFKTVGVEILCQHRVCFKKLLNEEKLNVTTVFISIEQSSIRTY